MWLKSTSLDYEGNPSFANLDQVEFIDVTPAQLGYSEYSVSHVGKFTNRADAIAALTATVAHMDNWVLSEDGTLAVNLDLMVGLVVQSQPGQPYEKRWAVTSSGGTLAGFPTQAEAIAAVPALLGKRFVF